MSKVCAYYHLVFATRGRRPSLPMDKKSDLYKYIFAIIKSEDCWVERINGISDHIHIALSLNQNVSLAHLVQKIKQASSHWLKGNAEFPLFDGWSKGYYAYTYGPERREITNNYIANQETHHLNSEFKEEMKRVADYCHFNWVDEDWQ